MESRQPEPHHSVPPLPTPRPSCLHPPASASAPILSTNLGALGPQATPPLHRREQLCRQPSLAKGSRGSVDSSLQILLRSCPPSLPCTSPNPLISLTCEKQEIGGGMYMMLLLSQADRHLGNPKAALAWHCREPSLAEDGSSGVQVSFSLPISPPISPTG